MQKRPPQFPVGLELLAGIKRWDNRAANKPLHIGAMTVTPLDLQHPDGVVALRVDCDRQGQFVGAHVASGFQPLVVSLGEYCTEGA